MTFAYSPMESVSNTPSNSVTDHSPKARPVIFLMGPTASGKTDLAVQLVKRLPLEIISVDSALVYRGLDIGTGKPDQEVLAVAPHRLIDIRDPANAYSAAEFATNARQAIAEVEAKGRIPLLVGGTGLYFRALRYGLAPLPVADPAVRHAIAEQAQQVGWAVLHERLAKVDPAAGARIHPNDPQRIQRALEIYELTGSPMTALLSRRAEYALERPVIGLALEPHDRPVFRERIASRFHGMLRQGLVTEVEELRHRGDLHQDLPSMRAVGYRQVWNYLDGRIDYPGMVETAITATHQLAKRQLTWLRSETGLIRFPCQEMNVLDEILRYLLRESLLKENGVGVGVS